MSKQNREKAPAKPAAKSRAFASADIALRISAAEFIAWQASLDLSNAAAARLLYVSANTLAAYRAAGAGPDIARQCRAIVAGIDPSDTMEHCALIGRLNAVLKAG